MIFQPILHGLSRVRTWLFEPPFNGAPWAVLFYVVAACLIYPQNGPFTGHLIGFDDHTRMVQVLDLINGNGWYNHTIMRADPPDGFETIWARIVDLPIALVILIAENFVDQQTAAIIASIIMPIVEVILLFYTTRYASRPLVGKKSAWLIVIFLLFTSVFYQRRFTFAGFHLGEASHHSWYVILNVLMIGSASRLVLGIQSRSADIYLAIAIGLFLAVGIEGFPLIAGTTFILATIGWIFDDPSLAHRGGKAIGWGALCGLLLLPLHEAPSHFLVVSFSQPSILGPALVAAAAFFLLMESKILKIANARRILSFPALIIIELELGELIVAIFPQILDGPAAALSPTERQLAANEHPESWTMIRAVPNPLEYFALLIPSVIAVAGGLAATRLTSSRRRQKMFLAYAGFAALDGVMAQMFWRYIHHAMTSSCLLLLWVWRTLRDSLRRGIHYDFVSVVIFILLCPIWMIGIPSIVYDAPFLSQVLLFPARIYSMQHSWNTCDPLDIASYLNTHYPPNTIVDVPDWDSANFLFHTNLVIDFLANYPSHDKFVENKLFFTTQDTEMAQSIALKHHFDLVASCVVLPISEETAQSRPYRQPMMMERLKEGNVPAWLVPIDMGLTTNYRLYKIDKASLVKSRPNLH